MTQPVWEQRVEELWASFDDYSEDDFRAKLDELAQELPADVAAFERAGAFDSTGHSDQAVPLYREALERGLEDPRRRRAVIQLASSLRNIGEAEESVRLLEAERERTSDELDDAVDAFLALALVDTGREREAAALLLTALARHLPRYQRSAANYARSLL
jgi:thioredoxin-like negative regulator of GroEL